MNKHKVVIFDGVCNLCNGTVRFIAPRDTKDVFKFCSLQSPAGRVLLNQHNITREDANSSIVLIDGEKVYRKSTAVLRILKDLKWPWPVLYASALIPSFIRDPCYNFIARNRYRIFGKSDVCMAPTKQLRAKFIEEEDQLL